jgi:zinc/manganese transport system substrate-binding protein
MKLLAKASILVCLCGVLAASSAWAKLNVVATLADFGSIAEQIGGDKVKVISLARGTEDPHFVDARPSHITTLNKADVLLEGGLELEIGWLPPLVNSARNGKILTGAKGRVVMADGIHIMEVPLTPVDRSMGDVHPLGNPHFWLDPENGKIMAAHLANVFSELDSSNTRVYQANLKAFNDRVDRKMAEWTKMMAPHRGAKIVTYHKSFEYFAARFGLDVIGQLEPKPGIEPSPTHIAALIPRAKEAGVKLVIVEPYRPRKPAEYVAHAIGAKLLLLPEKVGGNPQTKDYISLFDYDIQQIVNALKQ